MSEDLVVIELLQESILRIISFQYHYHKQRFGESESYAAIEGEIYGIIQDGSDVIERLAIILADITNHLHTTTIHTIHMLNVIED